VFAIMFFVSPFSYFHVNQVQCYKVVTTEPEDDAIRDSVSFYIGILSAGSRVRTFDGNI
jgi:hypothetical protein